MSGEHLSSNERVEEIRRRVAAFNHFYNQNGGVKTDEFDALEIALAEIDRLTRREAELVKALEEARRAAETAYGYLWHINTEPGTPNRCSAETAAKYARKALLEVLTKDQVASGIKEARLILWNLK